MIWMVCITAAVLILIAIEVFRKDHYEAIRHEFYQVWETIEEMRGDS